MLKLTTCKNDLPQLDGRALDAIKLSAAILMLIDHINVFLLGETQGWMLLLGRGAFPLFCYAAAVSVLRHGDNVTYQWRYLSALFLLALAVEPVSLVTRDGSMNVIFTLALGSLVAVYSDQIKRTWLYTGYLLSILAIFHVHGVEFGLPGIFLPSAILLLLRGDKNVWPFVVLLMFCMNISDLDQSIVKNGIVDTFIAALMMFIAAFVLSIGAVFSAHKIFPQGARFLSRYALHIFYPAHLLILFILKGLK